MSGRSSLPPRRDGNDHQVLASLLILTALAAMATLGGLMAFCLAFSGEWLAAAIVVLGCASGIAIVLCAADEVA